MANRVTRTRIGSGRAAFTGLAVAGLVAFGLTPVLAQDNVYRPQGRLSTQDQGYAETNSPGRTGDQQSPATARLLVRIDQLEAELGRLTGEFERLQFRYERLNTMVTQIVRAQNEAGMRGAPPVGQAGFGQTQPDDGTGSLEGSGEDESQQGIAPVAPSTRASGPVTLQPPSGDPREDFKTARSLLLRGEFEAAEAAFRQFVAAYPDSDFAGEAQYWIGESLFVRELYGQAAKAYLTAAKSYPKGPRAADSLLKLAHCFNKLEDNDKACRTLRELSQRYPNASEPVLRSQSKARAEFGCSG